MKTKIVLVLLAPFLSTMFLSCAGLPGGMKEVTVDKLYVSSENGVQKLITVPVRMVVPDECGTAEVDLEYVSTETRVLESGKKVASRKVETIPARRLFCPPGIFAAPASRPGATRYHRQAQVPYGNAMADHVCAGFGGLAGVREVFGCR